jgi:hypothetical protein
MELVLLDLDRRYRFVQRFDRQGSVRYANGAEYELFPLFRFVVQIGNPFVAQRERKLQLHEQL